MINITPPEEFERQLTDFYQRLSVLEEAEDRQESEKNNLNQWAENLEQTIAELKVRLSKLEDKIAVVVKLVDTHA